MAASTAKDWAFIDSWLSKLVPNQRLPDFERNTATLTALLALATVHEAATNDQDLLFSSSSSALARIADDQLHTDPSTEVIPSAQNGPAAPRNLILNKVAAHLTREGKTALKALADVSVQHSIFLASPEDLGREFVNLQTSLCETEQALARTNALNEHLLLELQSSEKELAVFENSTYSLPTELPKQNLDLQRKTKLNAKQVSEARERQKTPLSTPPRSLCTIDSVMKQEEQLLGLLTRKKNLASQMAAFRKLPSDPAKARDQLAGLEEQLKGLTIHRDSVFEGLVEKASPVKHR